MSTFRMYMNQWIHLVFMYFQRLITNQYSYSYGCSRVVDSYRMTFGSGLGGVWGKIPNKGIEF